MKDFTFRIRFKLAESCVIVADSNSAEILLASAEKPLRIYSEETDKSISQSKKLILESSGWLSNQDAERASKKYRDVLIVALTSLGIGAYFEPGSAVFETGVVYVEFGMGFGVNLLIGKPWERLENLFEQVILHGLNLSNRHRLALELFNASFFESSQYARFLTLVMAVEALLEPLSRPASATAHVEHLIELTKETTSLSKEEKCSLLGSLGRLREESIGQTVKRLASHWLGDTTYMNKKASAFFAYCYNLRSNLVHGNEKRLSLDEVKQATVELEAFVSDLLSAILIQNSASFGKANQNKVEQ